MVSSFLVRSSCRAVPRISQQYKLTRRSTIIQSSLYSSSSAKYQKSYKLEGTGEGTKVEITTNTGHYLATDIPKPMGGRDTAPQPVETLMASWMGCTQATALFVGRHLPERLSISKMEFDNIEAFRDERGALQLPIDTTPEIPSRIQRITGTIRVYERRGNPISTEQMELLKEQTEIRCPVANMMLASGCAIDVEWVDGSFAVV
ncbi:unnamed protein product [Cylindrotheca closterium]|uniref:OsmC-like protein n=1 Tax=Cylindrotheca closterium TaxID=2856 RepID=A0AAD2G085_9STRA|nr:unnamed protein product [Cylindrotheca closterium]